MESDVNPACEAFARLKWKLNPSIEEAAIHWIQAGNIELEIKLMWVRKVYQKHSIF